MFTHSLLITGGTLEERFNKALSFFPQPPPHPDLIIYESASTTGINDIRRLIHDLSLKPFEENKKIAIIKEAEKLTTQAQNCLLKTLEEPPANTKIVLLAERPSYLSETIVSRCQVLNLKLKEEFFLDKENFLENIKFLKEIFENRGGERLRFSAKFPQEKQKLSSFFDLLIATCQRLLLFQYGIRKKGDFFNRLSKVGKIKLPPKNLVRTIRLATTTKLLIEKNVNLKLAIDCFLLDLPTFHLQGGLGRTPRKLLS